MIVVSFSSAKDALFKYGGKMTLLDRRVAYWKSTVPYFLGHPV